MKTTLGVQEMWTGQTPGSTAPPPTTDDTKATNSAAARTTTPTMIKMLVIDFFRGWPQWGHSWGLPAMPTAHSGQYRYRVVGTQTRLTIRFGGSVLAR